MSVLAGLLAVSISIIGWGSYFVPMRRINKYDPFYFQLLMCLAIFGSSVLISLLFKSFVFSYLGILSGILWAVGNILSAQAVKYGGLAKTFPVWAGIGILISVLWGLLFFKESFNFLFLGIFGLFLLIFGIYLVSSISDRKEMINVRGVLLAIIAGLFFGSYLVPLKMSGIGPIPFLFSMSLGIFIGGTLIFLRQPSKIDSRILLPGFLSGVIWNIANLASFFAVDNLGIVVGFPLTQMALFISVLWGVIYFEEIKNKESIKKLTIGAILLFGGAILLSISK